MHSISLALSHTHTVIHTVKYLRTHTHDYMQPQSHNTVHSYKHTDRFILSVAILRLSTGSGLTVAEDKWFHHSRRQNRTLQDTDLMQTIQLTLTGLVWLCTCDWICVCERVLPACSCNCNPISATPWLLVSRILKLKCKSFGFWASTKSLKYVLVSVQMCVCVFVRSVPGWWCFCRHGTC